MVFEHLRTQWLMLAEALHALRDEDYSMIHPVLHASLGQHTRHVIEILQCVLSGLETGVVDYVNRSRDLEVESNKAVALHLLQKLPAQLPLNDRPLALRVGSQDAEPCLVPTTYYRELVYNAEHAVHHLAIMRIGFEALGIRLPACFGVAESTQRYRSTLLS